MYIVIVGPEVIIVHNLNHSNHTVLHAQLYTPCRMRLNKLPHLRQLKVTLIGEKYANM